MRARPPDRLVAGRVGVERVDFERDQLALGRRALALHQRRLAADKIALVPGDPAVHAGHARSMILREFRRPDAEALFEPERQQRVIAVFPDPEVASGFEQGPAQVGVLERAAVDLVAEFAGDRQARHLRPHQADIQCRRAHEGQGGVRHVLMRDAREQFARFRAGQRKPITSSEMSRTLTPSRAWSRTSAYAIGEGSRSPRSRMSRRPS